MDKPRKHILIVEDEEPLARLIKERLETQGYEVTTEIHGKAALAFAADHRLDLAILDINLPDVNGFDVARELRRLYHPWVLPILMLTIKDKPIDQLRGFANGADAYMTKPFDSQELLHTVALLTGEPALKGGAAEEGMDDGTLSI
jgi:two-component system response regulator VicR